MREEIMESILTELVASHAEHRQRLAALQNRESLAADVAAMRRELVTMLSKQGRMDAFLTKHYARSDTDIGASARAIFGDEVADQIAHKSGAKEIPQ